MPWETISGEAPIDEGRFQSWYHGYAKKLDLDMNPDDPQHFYDYRAAYRAGAKPDETGHWPSQFKREGHPQLVIDGVDTRTGEPAANADDKWETISGPGAPDPPLTGVDDPRFIAARERGTREGTAAAAGPSLAILGAGLAGAAAPAAMKLMAHPAVAGTLGAVHGYQHGGVLGAIGEGLVGVAGGPVLGKLGRFLGAGKMLRPAAQAAKAVAPIAEAAPAVATAAAEAAPAVSSASQVVPSVFHGDKVFLVVDAVGKPLQVFKNAGEALQFAHMAKRAGTAAKVITEAAPAVAKAVQAAPAVASTVAKAVPTAAASAARHSALVQFAKDAAARNPKLGEKIWVALDKAGNPVKLLTPDQAGAAKRAGIETTWVRNLWR